MIRISCYYHDKLSKDDLIGYKDLLVKEMDKGMLKDKWISIFNRDTGSKGNLHIMYQICSINWIPFQQNPYIPLRKINIHIMDGYEIQNVELIGKTGPYIKLKLNDQEFVQQTLVINNTLNPIWEQTITLYTLCEKPTLQIELRDEATGKDPLLGDKTIDLGKIVEDEIIEFTEELIPEKEGKREEISIFIFKLLIKHHLKVHSLQVILMWVRK